MVELVDLVRPESYRDAFLQGFSFHQLSSGSGHRSGPLGKAKLVAAGTRFSKLLEEGAISVRALRCVTLDEVGPALAEILKQRTVGKVVGGLTLRQLDLSTNLIYKATITNVAVEEEKSRSTLKTACAPYYPANAAELPIKSVKDPDVLRCHAPPLCRDPKVATYDTVLGSTSNKPPPEGLGISVNVALVVPFNSSPTMKPVVEVAVTSPNPFPLIFRVCPEL